MLTAVVEYFADMSARACRTSSADRSRSLLAPMTARIGSRTFWFLVIVLGERPGEPAGEPVLGGLPDGVVGVPGLGGDALVELGVQVPEFVDDGGLGLACR